MSDKAEELYDAALEGDLKKVKKLLASGVDANGVDNDIPVLLAATEGHLEVVRALIEAGADIDKVPDDEDTYIGKDSAFAEAIRNNHPDVAVLLLEHGANPFGVNDEEAELEEFGEIEYDTPLFNAIETQYNDLAKRMIPLMLDQYEGALNHIYGPDYEAISALMIAAAYDNLEMVEYLIAINQGVDDRQTVEHRNTALHYALGVDEDSPEDEDREHTLSIVKALIEAGLSPDKENADGVKPRDLGNKEIQNYFKSI